MSDKNKSKPTQVLSPIIRKILPEILARKLIGVQPMDAPVGDIFKFKFPYNEGGILKAEIATIEKEREEKRLKKLTSNGTIQ